MMAKRTKKKIFPLSTISKGETKFIGKGREYGILMEEIIAGLHHCKMAEEKIGLIVLILSVIMDN